MEPMLHTFEFTSDEVDVLNKVIREHKVNLSLEEVAMVQMGRTQSPFLTALIKIATKWEELQEAKKAAAEAAPEEAPAEAPAKRSRK